jgi:hypothetical protein
LLISKSLKVVNTALRLFEVPCVYGIVTVLLLLPEEEPPVPYPYTLYVPDDRVRSLLAVIIVPVPLVLAEVINTSSPLTTWYNETLAVRSSEKLDFVLDQTLYWLPDADRPQAIDSVLNGCITTSSPFSARAFPAKDKQIIIITAKDTKRRFIFNSPILNCAG